jgi:alpha-tubulin suppressor-like RCC1 family protein
MAAPTRTRERRSPGRSRFIADPEARHHRGDRHQRRRAALRRFRAALLVIVAVVALVASCTEGPGPTAAGDAPAPARLTLSARVISAGRAIKVVASYLRTGTTPLSVPFDSATVALEGTETQISVRLDLAPCLADPARERPAQSADGQAAQTCVLHLVLTLLDGSNEVIDQSSLPPMVAEPGQQVSAPEVSLGVQVGAVTVDPRTATINAIGYATTLHATVVDRQNRPIDQPALSFTTIDPEIASVDPLGRVTAKAVGTTRVVATSRDKSDTATVVVRQLPRTVSAIVAGRASPNVGDTLQLDVTAVDSNDTAIPRGSLTPTYSSGDPTVVAVDAATGRAVTTGSGETTLIATVGTASASVPLVVRLRVEGGSVVALQAGADQTCLILGGALYCAGTNQGLPNLGIGSIDDAPHPTLQQLPGSYAALPPTGIFHNCALRQDGTAACWGLNNRGQLGVDSTACGSVRQCVSPLAVAGGHTFRSLAVGSQTTCGLATTGSAFCWGRNSEGELGIGTVNESGTFAHVPQAVTGGLTFTQLAAGTRHACGLTSSGRLYCWGGDEKGELGTAAPGAPCGTSVARGCVTSPRLVEGPAFASVSSSGFSTCALTGAGGAYCWGANDSGQLGAGVPADTFAHPTPTAVAGGLSFVTLSSHQRGACGLTRAGHAYCWGSNFNGELGIAPASSPDSCPFPEDATPQPCALTPVPVPSSLIFASITKGFDHTCATTTHGAVYCWGDNTFGQLANGTMVSTPTPTPIVLPSGISPSRVPSGSRFLRASSSPTRASPRSIPR